MGTASVASAERTLYAAMRRYQDVARSGREAEMLNACLDVHEANCKLHALRDLEWQRQAVKATGAKKTSARKGQRRAGR